jgi:hypothetical protein
LKKRSQFPISRFDANGFGANKATRLWRLAQVKHTRYPPTR